MPDLDAVITKASGGLDNIGDGAVDNGIESGDSGGDTHEASADDAGSETTEVAKPEGTETEGAEGKPAAGDEPAKPATTVEEEVADLTTAELAGQTIPVSRHKAVLTKARKATEALQKEVADLAWAKTPDTQQRLRALEIADRQPELFVDVLLKDEQFGPLFRKVLGAQQGTEKPAAATQPAGTAGAASTERPQPDALLPDGSAGYSADQTAALVAYELGQFEAKVNKQFEERFGEVKPVLDQHKAAQDWNTAVQAQTKALADARSQWPGFTTHEAAVREHLLAPGNEKVSLLDAYMKVVVPKMQGDADTIRKQVLEEMNKRPAAANPGPRTTTGSAAATTQGGDKVENAIRNAIARAEGATA